MTHVLIMSVGPVQEFIAGGRKCRDLWFGSWLLSELSFAAASAIRDLAGEEDALVFPGALEESIEKNVANKIVARVADAAAAAGAAKAAQEARLREIAERAFARVGAGLFEPVPAWNQVRDLIELTWAAASESVHGGYGGARKEAERLLAARKNTKLWAQPSWGKAGVRKSSLDGLRESVLRKEFFEILGRFGVHPAEQLCGIGLLKRFGRTEPGDASSVGKSSPERVASVTHIATLPFLKGLEKDARAKKDFLALIDAIGEDVAQRVDVVQAWHPVTLHYDASILFPGRLREILEESAGDGQAAGLSEGADRALRNFLCGRAEPSPYFAVLLADGDRMGKAIDKMDDWRGHRQLSVALAGFAGEARTIVQSHEGQTIYAGGDDVLAFVPLHTLVACTDELASKFADRLSGFPDEDGRAPTLSMGIAIAHALTPLDDSLEAARAAERDAKAVDGKDAASFRVVKRGGEPVSFSGKRADVTGLLRELMGWHREGSLSSKAQYELMDLARLGVGKPSGEDGKQVDKVIAEQTARVLARRRERGGGDASWEVLQRAVDVAGKWGPAELGRALYVAQILERAERLTMPSKQNQQGKEVAQ